MLETLRGDRKIQIFLILLILLIFGFWLRYQNIQPANLAFDYDQYEDLFYTYKIAVDHRLPIIGRAIYGNPALHHGVFSFYLNLPAFLVSAGNPFVIAYWNSLLNGATAILLFFFAKSLFKSTSAGLITAFLATVSFEFIKFSNWLTNETVGILIVPLFYLGLWSYYQNKRWGLILAAVGLGLSLQTGLAYLYLIPIALFFWIIFRPKLPDLKLTLTSFLLFLLTISTMILTEIKLKFAAFYALLHFSDNFGDSKLNFLDRLHLFSRDFFTDFSSNLFPQKPDLGIYIGAGVILLTVLLLLNPKRPAQEKKGVYFLLLYLFSPLVTLILGYHDKPWFLIGIIPAIVLLSGYVISKVKPPLLILPILLLIGFSNIALILNRPQESYKLFGVTYDQTSHLAYQLQVVDYTYKSSKGLPFAINAVTYPLYYNGMWAYLYNWYGKSYYNYLPGWSGGDQLHPYDLLLKPSSQEEYLYMLISDTARIPLIHKILGRTWASEKGKLIEEKTFGSFIVLKIKLTPKASLK
ncbi:MAG: glycosyltransferase family 39 protein [Patescibacteria group bacterium]|nr:glycosyltransferase family 39 protein [Patescibacteria group bacterium]